MTQSARLSCFIIGETSLSVRCGDVLREQGHELLGVVSDNPQVVGWANECGVAVIDPGADLVAEMSGRPFDYLFSIVNYSVLPDALLALPGKLAINYHDAPLPRYAGVNATSWALLHRETTHGVSWHVMTDLVDAGPTLVQRAVDIGESDRALSLNMKCYDAAVESFREMVDALADGTAELTAQDLELRTYFGFDKQPLAESVLDFEKDAEALDATARALDFGAAYYNTLALPKVLVGDTVLACPRLEIFCAPVSSPPGTILSIDENAVAVATPTRPVRLRGLVHLDGRPVEPEELERLGLVEGARLQGPSESLARRLAEASGEVATHERYWAPRLAAMRPPDMPYIESVGSEGDHVAYVEHAIELPGDIERLFETDERRDETLVAAFAAFVSRLTDDAGYDLGLGTDRVLLDLAGLESFLGTHVPLRISARPDDGFPEFVKKVRRQLRRLRRRKTYVRDLPARHPELNGAAGPRRAPAYPVTVERLDASGRMRAEDGVRLAFGVSEDGRRCAWRYDARAITPENVARLTSQLTTFLTALAAQRDRPVAEQPILTDGELRQIVHEWNADTLDFDRSEAIHDLFDAQAERRPDDVAIWLDGETLTYGELSRWANAIAARLVAEGVRPEQPVGICAARSFEMVAAMLGVLEAGGTYIPLDPAYPEARLSFILEDSGAGIVLSRTEQLDSIPERDGLRVINLDEMRAGSFKMPAGVELPESRSRSLAFVIYTSGSTGRPKGVGIEHRSVAALAHWTRREFDDEDLTGVLASSSICFDLSVFEILVTLMLGGRVVLVDSALDLAELPRTAGVKLINSVPSVMERVLQIEGTDWTVRTFTMAGEFLSTQLVDDLYAKTGAERVFDLYGASEDTTHSTIVLREPGKPATVGKPMANSQLYILDRRLRPVPVGVVGEICLGGEGLARGYLNRPELTAEKFLRNPFLDDPEARIYRTGDLGRFRPDGNVVYAGRMDNQVKIRGFRIELGEIEAVLSSHAGVRDAVALAWDEGREGKTLAAYVVAEQDGTRPGIGELRRFVMERLPEYMVPTEWVFMEAFPRTPNGKTDRKALERPEAARPELAGSLVAPRDEVETRLVAIWEEVLKKSPVGVRDDFFELGGHSLLAVRLFARIAEEFDRELRPDTLFQGPTIEHLADIVRQEEWSLASQTLIPIQPEGSKPPLFVVPPAASPGVVFTPLSQRLGSDQPLYGLTPPDPHHQEITDDWFEKTATRFIEDIKSVQPEGPYHVGGSCFGAFIAFEVAQQLVAGGDEVAYMAVIDAVAPFSIGTSFKKSLKYKLRKLKYVATHMVVDRYRGHRTEYVLLPGFGVQYLLDEVTRPEAPYKKQVWDANLRAASTYIAHPYPGRVTLMLSEVNARFPKIRSGWERLARGGVDYHEIPGKHIDTLREPNVAVAAEKIHADLSASRPHAEEPARAAG